MRRRRVHRRPHGAVGAFGRLMKALGLDDASRRARDGLDMGVPLTAGRAGHPRRRDSRHLRFAAPAGMGTAAHRSRVSPFPCSIRVRCSTRPRPRTTAWRSRSKTLCSAPFSRSPAPLRFQRPATAPARAAPASGQHTAEILAELRQRRRERPQEEARPSRAGDGRPLLDGLKVSTWAPSTRARTPPGCWPTLAPTSSSSSRSPATRCAGLSGSSARRTRASARSPRTSRIPRRARCSAA